MCGPEHYLAPGQKLFWEVTLNQNKILYFSTRMYSFTLPPWLNQAHAMTNGHTLPSAPCTDINVLLALPPMHFLSISPGRSYPSIQRGGKPLMGDLPITVPSPVTFEFGKLWPTLSTLPMAILPVKCWVSAQHLLQAKIYTMMFCPLCT